MRTARGLLSLFAVILYHLACQADSEGTVTQKAAVPIARLFSITFRDVWSASRWQTPQTANTVELRTVIPYKLWEQPNLMRITVPYRTDFDSGSGLGDTRIFNLVMFPTGRRLWGLGPAVNLRPRLQPGTDTFQGGFVLSGLFVYERMSVGLLNQNLFSSRIAATTLQPVLSYTLSDHWTVGYGELPFVFDWKMQSFTFVPLGFALGYQVNIAGQTMRFFVNPQYNTRNLAGAPQWTITTGISFLVLPPTTEARSY